MTYRIQTPEADRATQVIKGDFGKSIADSKTDYLDLEIDSEQLQKVIKMLSLKDVPILGVNKLESSLEDAFIKLTGGGLTIE